MCCIVRGCDRCLTSLAVRRRRLSSYIAPLAAYALCRCRTRLGRHASANMLGPLLQSDEHTQLGWRQRLPTCLFSRVEDLCIARPS